MSTHLTLRQRVTLWCAAVVALSLITCGTGGAWFLYRKAVAQLDRQLELIAEQFFEQQRIHGGEDFALENPHEVLEWLPPPTSQTRVQIEHKGTILFRSASLGERELPREPSRFHFTDMEGVGRMRAGAVAEGHTVVRVAAPVHGLNELLQNLVIVFSVGLPVMIAFVVFGGRSIARQALAPVQQIADSAEQITSQQLGTRVPVPAPQDEIRRLALVLNATLDRLEKSFHQARRFSADASHELKTPLTLLHAELETLLNAPGLGDRERASVAEALETTKRLSDITTSLLLLASADAGKLQVDRQPIDLAEVIRDCMDDAQIIAEAAGLSVDLEIAGAAPVSGDLMRLRHIVCNLFHNAVKYNQTGGRVSILLRTEGSWCALEVSNTGPGIPRQHTPHIFERFYRSEHHAHIPGTGLGLALARELARAHDGTLELVRSDEATTVFRLSLPLRARD